MLAHPAKKMMPQAAKMRIRLELVILVFMVRCVLTGCKLAVESASTAGVNSIFRLSRKTIARGLNGDEKHPQNLTRLVASPYRDKSGRMRTFLAVTISEGKPETENQAITGHSQAVASAGAVHTLQ
jgi:hypothetical protein